MVNADAGALLTFGWGLYGQVRYTKFSFPIWNLSGLLFQYFAVVFWATMLPVNIPAN